MNKILIVEDETLVALEIASALKKDGYQIIDCVENGEDALKAIEKEKPDLIMMDINIEGDINGIETLKKVYELYGEIPSIFLTAYTDRSMMDSAIEMSPKAYITKPFRRDELYVAVKLAIAKNKEINKIYFKHCIYEIKNSILIFEDKNVSLTNKEKQLLDLLLKNKNSILPFAFIDSEIWADKEISTTTRRTLIHRINSKINEILIETIKNIGCRIQL